MQRMALDKLEAKMWKSSFFGLESPDLEQVTFDIVVESRVLGSVPFTADEWKDLFGDATSSPRTGSLKSFFLDMIRLKKNRMAETISNILMKSKLYTTNAEDGFKPIAPT